MDEKAHAEWELIGKPPVMGRPTGKKVGSPPGNGIYKLLFSPLSGFKRNQDRMFEITTGPDQFWNQYRRFLREGESKDRSLQYFCEYFGEANMFLSHAMLLPHDINKEGMLFGLNAVVNRHPSLLTNWSIDC
jgi:hypothetical protein